jgi:hypothetical protein
MGGPGSGRWLKERREQQVHAANGYHHQRNEFVRTWAGRLTDQQLNAIFDQLGRDVVQLASVRLQVVRKNGDLEIVEF